MTEERLRERERRFKESGSDEDELAYLQELLRAGRPLDERGYVRLHALDAEAAAAYAEARSLGPLLLLGPWVAEDRTKSLRITLGDDGGLRVTVWSGVGGAPLAEARETRWRPREGKPQETYARSRLGYLSVELGSTGIGPTYDLMLATANDDVAAYGDFAWRQVDPSTRRQDARLFPEEGASFYEAVLGAWDDTVEEMRPRWITPLSTYRPATEAEQAQLP